MPLAARTWSAPPPPWFHSVQFFTPARERAPAAPRQCTGARPSARERAPGRARARWRPRRGRRLGRGIRCLEHRTPALEPCRPRISGPDPAQVGPPASLLRSRSLRARPAWAQGSHPPAPALPGPCGSPAPRHGPCPLPTLPGPDCSLASGPLSPRPGKPLALALARQSWTTTPLPSRQSAPGSKEHPPLSSTSADPALSAPDSTLASS